MCLFEVKNYGEKRENEKISIIEANVQVIRGLLPVSTADSLFSSKTTASCFVHLEKYLFCFADA